MASPINPFQQAHGDILNANPKTSEEKDKLIGILFLFIIYFYFLFMQLY